MGNASSYVLDLEGVSRTFGECRAVDGLTVRLPPSTFLGLLGRNGAGKSTTIRLLTGLLKPTAGRIRVLGLPLPEQEVEVKRQVGVVGEDLGLVERLTGEQHLRFVGRMRGLSESTIDQRVAELFQLLDLDPAPGALICDYSYGMKKKVALAAALLHGPRLLFLDEPFEGIDPVTAITIRTLLERLRTARGQEPKGPPEPAVNSRATCCRPRKMHVSRVRAAASDDDLTLLLKHWSAGDADAGALFIESAYPELRRIAAAHFRRQRRDHTLQATALLHEAYQRLCRQVVPYENRQHFFALISIMMRRVLVDHARARQRRGIETSLSLAHAGVAPRSIDLIALDAALAKLEQEHPFEASVVKLRYFAALSIDETAVELEVGHATVERAWALARAFLARELGARKA